MTELEGLEFGGEVETRAATVADIDYPRRTIELIVMPYERVARVPYHGRLIEEVCSRGAFGEGLAHRRNVKVNRDHDYKRPVGRAIALHPSREEGLVAELRIANTELGDETLALADGGILDASAGFGLLRERGSSRPYPDAEVWETRSRRRLNRLWLDHIGMTSNPAYEDAQVLAVRSASPPPPAAAEPTARPNLERLLAELRAEELERRYSQIR